MDNHKVCPDCKQMLSPDQFYQRGGGYLHTYCKECTKSRTRKRAAEGLVVSNPQQALIPSEQDVIKELTKRGIPALPAKALGHRFGDVIAWGCVPIEVKSATRIDDAYAWGFSAHQRKTGIRGMFVILVCYDEQGQNPVYHIFDAKSPWFYINGQLKKGIGYKPVRGNGGRKPGISDQEFENSRDAWHLIEARFNHVVLRLRSGAPMTEFLQPTK